MNNIPLPLQFIATVIIIIASIEVGNLVGRALQGRKKNENDGMISVISGSILGLLSFILAFNFGIVSDRFDARKALVRDEANQIGTAWQRTDFIPEPDRSASRKLLKEYLDIRIRVLKSANDEAIMQGLGEAEKIQQELWALGVAHAHSDMSSDVGAMYFDALNKLVELQGLRVAIAYRGHMPTGLWISLYILLVFAMLSIGYYAAIIQSKRNFASIILALSFSLVISIISNLDRLQTNRFQISQQPFIDLRTKIASQ